MAQNYDQGLIFADNGNTAVLRGHVLAEVQNRHSAIHEYALMTRIMRRLWPSDYPIVDQWSRRIECLAGKHDAIY